MSTGTDPDPGAARESEDEAGQLDSIRARLDRPPGTQTVASIRTMESALPYLPDDAFGNLLVVSPQSPRRVEAKLRDRGVNPRRCGLVPISGSRSEPPESLWTTDPVSPSDLTGISMRYSRAMRHVASDAGWVLFDNVQLLLMYADEERVYGLLGSLTNAAKQKRVPSVYSFARDTMAEATYSRFAGLFDAQVDLRDP